LIFTAEKNKETVKEKENIFSTNVKKKINFDNFNKGHSGNSESNIGNSSNYGNHGNSNNNQTGILNGNKLIFLLSNIK